MSQECSPSKKLCDSSIASFSTDRAISNTHFNVLRDNPELLEFKFPNIVDDNVVHLRYGSNLSIYRWVENDGKRYFDSIVPLRQFIYRHDDSSCRFFDILSLSKRDKNILIDYSNRQDNALIPVDKILTDFDNYLMVRMRFYGGHPMVSEESSVIFDSDMNIMMAQTFNLLVKNKNVTFQYMYDMFIQIAVDLMSKLNLYISDIAPNNILVYCSVDNTKTDATVDFSARFIDILDIKRFRGSKIFDMACLFSTTRDRLAQSFVKALSKEALSMFPTYEQKLDKNEIAIHNDYMNSLFDLIQRPRFIEIRKDSIVPAPGTVMAVTKKKPAKPGRYRVITK